MPKTFQKSLTNQLIQGIVSVFFVVSVSTNISAQNPEKRSSIRLKEVNKSVGLGVGDIEPYHTRVVVRIYPPNPEVGSSYKIVTNPKPVIQDAAGSIVWSSFPQPIVAYFKGEGIKFDEEYSARFYGNMTEEGGGGGEVAPYFKASLVEIDADLDTTGVHSDTHWSPTGSQLEDTMEEHFGMNIFQTIIGSFPQTVDNSVPWKRMKVKVTTKWSDATPESIGTLKFELPAGVKLYRITQLGGTNGTLLSGESIKVSKDGGKFEFAVVTNEDFTGSDWIRTLVKLDDVFEASLNSYDEIRIRSLGNINDPNGPSGTNGATGGLVKIVPAVDLNGGGGANGRGSIPEIPKNAKLPTTLSGGGVENVVRVGIWVQGAPGTRTYRLSSLDTAKVTVEKTDIVVSIPSGETSAYSTTSVKVTGGSLSEDANDFGIIMAQFVKNGVPQTAVVGHGLLKYKILPLLAANTDEFVGLGLRTFSTPMTAADSIIITSSTDTDPTKSGEKPNGTRQATATTAFPARAYNQWTTSKLDTKDGTITVGAHAGDNNTGPDDFTSGVHVNHNMKFKIITDPPIVASNMELELDIEFERRVKIVATTLTTNWLNSLAGIAMSFGPFSIGLSLPKGTVAVAGGNHDFNFKSVSGVWSPHATGTVPGGADLYSSSYRAPGGGRKSMDLPETLNLTSSTAVIDKDGALLKSSVGVGARRTYGFTYSSVAFVYAKLFKPSASLSDITIKKLP